ncbi:MAG: hypothetical protein QOJ70_1474 [Acidobacteriota bacterium]|jgi:hypothetical protein|nr:hypothetical protein [Acidobacteriota bacterium]
MADLPSYKIVAGCRQRHGDGRLFFRTDGREHEERRAAQRQRFLEANPDIGEQHREMIRKAAVTPGMTRGEATAAWGLLDEDTRNVFGHVTDEEGIAYAYFTGFDVGGLHALYMMNDVVAGVLETEEFIAPHERELDMKLAERYLGLFCFYDWGDGTVRGSDMDQYKNPPDILAMGFYRLESIPHFLTDARALEMLELRVRGEGCGEQYEAALRRLGTDVDHATPAERCEAAVAAQPRPYMIWLFTMP